MSSESSAYRKPYPVLRILAWALSVGIVSLAAGFFGPMFFSTGNLASLLGIFVTGPLGTLAGGLVGALRVARYSLRVSIVGIATVWVMTLLYTFWGFALSARVAIPTTPLQLMVIASTIFLFSSRGTRAQLPDGMRQCGPIVVAAQVTILLMTLFPPVIRPWWVPARYQSWTNEPPPWFAFILDWRFDPGRHFPQYAVNREALAWEWIITAAVAAGLCLLMRALRARRVV